MIGCVKSNTDFMHQNENKMKICKVENWGLRLYFHCTIICIQSFERLFLNECSNTLRSLELTSKKIIKCVDMKVVKCYYNQVVN